MRTAASSEASQTIRAANSQVLAPRIWRLSDKILVTSSPTNVVMSADAPRSA